MDISNLLQFDRNFLRILQRRQKDQAVYFTHLSVLFIDRTDLSCHNKPGLISSRHRRILDLILFFQPVQTVFCRRKLLRQLFPPLWMSKVSCPHNVDSFSPRPQLQMLRRTFLTGSPGISGMDM